MSEFRCEFCDSDCNSASELIACRQRCEEDDKNTREWFANYNPHRKD